MFSRPNGKIIVKAVHSFIIFTQEKKGWVHCDRGHDVPVYSLWSYMIWVQKVIFSLVLPDIFVLFSAAAQPPSTAPSGWVWHCDCWQLCSFFLSLYLYFALTFWLHWCRNIGDCRPILTLKVIFLFPFPSFHSNLYLFIFFQIYCPVFFIPPFGTSSIPFVPSTHAFSHLLSPPTSVSFHIYPISLWLPAKQIIS